MKKFKGTKGFESINHIVKKAIHDEKEAIALYDKMLVKIMKKVKSYKYKPYIKAKDGEQWWKILMKEYKQILRIRDEEKSHLNFFKRRIY